MNKNKYKDFIIIIFGSFITAMSFNLFLVPNKIAPGGLSGIATILHYTFNLPVGVTMLVLNIPLFIIGIKTLGGGFGVKTLIATILLSAFTDLVHVPVLTTNKLLASIYGGILMGAGTGLLFKVDASTGGTDMAAKIIHKYTPFIGIGWVMFVMDFLVVLVAAFVFNTELALYAIVSIFVSARIIDIIQEGFNSAKAFIIISNESQKIAQRIMKEMSRGVTGLHGRGMYSGYEKEVLICVINRSEIQKLKQIVVEEDPIGFVIVADVREVLGEGFTASASFHVK